ncbi:MAG: hypothetical protein GYA51_10570 [Candidatus Methanofastidiosa archaeon]|nr:hypothetical protein [Candidatus Methanofastidiosa archaeon]
MINCTKKNKKIQLVYSSLGKVIGRIENDTLIKNIYKSRHMLRIPPAICCDEYILDQAEDLGVVEIVINEVEEEKKYKATIPDFRKKGFPVRRGYSNQIGLTLAYWKTEPQDSDEQLTFDF